MNLGHYLDRHDRRVAATAFAGALCRRVLGPVLATQTGPTVQQLADAVGPVEVAPSAVLEAILAPSSDRTRQLRSASEEYAELRDVLVARYAGGGLALPARWAVDDRTSELIYTSVRLMRPRQMVEIGVGNGHSTFYVLNALRRNGVGRLTSLDISGHVGSLLTNSERRNWHLIVLQQRRGDRGLGDVVRALSPIDWCLHDGDHSYIGQREDLQIVRASLGGGGLLICDDADASRALVEVCSQYNDAGRVMVGDRKVLGVVRKAETAENAEAGGRAGGRPAGARRDALRGDAA